MTRLPEPLAELAARQHGVLRRAELSGVGLGRRAVEALIRQGVLIRAGRRVVRIAGAPATVLQAVLIACIDARGVASHLTAAVLHGLDGFRLTDRPEVLIHEARNTRSRVARLRTTSTLGPQDVTIIDGVPVTTIERTLLALASLTGRSAVGRELSEQRVADAFDQALASGRTTVEAIRTMLERCRRSGRGGVALVERLLDERAAGAITESRLERMTLEVIGGAGLPAPVCQAKVAPDGDLVARVDFLYPAQRTIIEVSGYRWHRTAAQMERDTARRRDLTRRGFLVYEFTYRSVDRRPGLLLSTVRHVLRGHRSHVRARPPP